MLTVDGLLIDGIAHEYTRVRLVDWNVAVYVSCGLLVLACRWCSYLIVHCVLSTPACWPNTIHMILYLTVSRVPSMPACWPNVIHMILRVQHNTCSVHARELAERWLYTYHVRHALSMTMRWPGVLCIWLILIRASAIVCVLGCCYISLWHAHIPYVGKGFLSQPTLLATVINMFYACF